MTDRGAIESELTQAASARAERIGLEQRLDRAREQLAATTQRVAEVRTKLAEEDEDVAKLMSFSPTRIWAALKGARAGDLDRETAEREAARYAVAVAAAHRDSAGP